MQAILADIQAELQRLANSKYQAAQQQFFKEGITLYGVRVGAVRKLAKQFWRQLPSKEKVDVLPLCEALLKMHQQETSVIAYEWVEKLLPKLRPSDFPVFDRWLKTYVRNWAQCDDLCSGPLGQFLKKYPEVIPKTRVWRKSQNRWVRRGSAVSLIVPVRAGQELPEVFAAAGALLTDEDDMVRKGYGWLLKEASNVFSQDVFDFVQAHKSQMPRVALRYAIEKMPPAWKKEAMQI